MRFDLHFHTNVSDGAATPETMITFVKQRGLDGFSVTDHDNPGDIQVYKELAEKYRLLYVSGIEVTAREGHVLVYTVPDNADILYEFTPHNPVQHYIDQADADVVIAPAHPFDYFRHGMGSTMYDYTWSAVETFNGSTVFPFANRRAHKAAQTLNAPEIGGSDAHTIYYVGKAYTEADAYTAEELIACIKKGKTKTGGAHISALQFSRRIVKSKMFK